MKRISTTILLLLCLEVTPFLTIAQSVMELQHMDTLTLSLSPTTADIQWQYSHDGDTFSDSPGATSASLTTIIDRLPVHFRARLTPEACDPFYTEPVQVVSSILVSYWSDPESWDSQEVPEAGEEVVIPHGKRIILDITPPSLGGLRIDGVLEFDRKDLELTSDWIIVHGTLQIGTEAYPFQQKAILTLTDTDRENDVMGMGTRGIMVMGGTLDLHGATPEVLWTKINDHAEAGATQLELAQAVEWKEGDWLALAPTDFYAGGSYTEPLQITGIADTQVQVDWPLQSFRWGKLQYATANGMSLEPSNLLIPPVPDTDSTFTPLILDERAEIGNLSRNIVIQAPDDDAWRNFGFGVHTMIMLGGKAYIDGVEFRRAGQSGRLRRYAFHWHMLSSNGSAPTQDAIGQYVRNSSINHSRNRGIVIHGTSGVTVKNNVLYNISGHGIFTEDAVEMRNIIDHNLVLRVRNPLIPLKQHEIGEFGSSGMWISNPNNTVVNNTVADCSGIGYWLAFPLHPWGENQEVNMNPSRILFGTFENNTAHSNRMNGVRLDDSEIDNDGNTFPRQYYSTTDGLNPVWPSPNLRRFALAKLTVWKNGSNGIWDRSTWPDNIEIVSADNCGRFFAGSGADGVIERSLVVGTSLNHLMNDIDRPAEADYAAGYSSSAPVAFATYHSSFDIKNNIVINFPAEAGTRSGVFSTEDYYIRPVEKGQLRNSNNLILQSHPGVKLPAIYSYFNLASALWDPHGIWGTAENYIVYDDPFLTYGKQKTVVSPDLETSGGVSVPGPFFGFEGFVLHGVGDTPPQNQPYFDLMGLHVQRFDQNLNEVATWTVPEAQPDYLLQHMRHFATSPDAIYLLTFPQESTLPTHFQVNVENMLSSSDLQVIGIQFDGARTPQVSMRSYARWFPYTQVGSLADVRNSAGETWWQDTANNIVWVKIRGGRWEYWTTNTNESVPTADELLYETTVLIIDGD